MAEEEWPSAPLDNKELYSTFYREIHKVEHNIVCGCCGCVGHDKGLFHYVSPAYCGFSLLQVDKHLVPFDFSCGVARFDENQVMIDRLAVDHSSGQISICVDCYKSLDNDCKPAEALANFRWIGDVPPELRGLTWIEEMLVARAHVVGRVVRLQDREAPGYSALKGHVILLPQDTTRLLDVLPISPASLSDLVYIVWVGNAPNRTKLSPFFTVRKQKVLDALRWLCNNHDDYRNVTINDTELSNWDSVFITENLLNSIAQVSDTSTDDASRSGLATEEIDNVNVDGDLPMTSSIILDTNSVKDSPDLTTLDMLTKLKTVTVINIVDGVTIMDDRTEGVYFTSAFPTLFPWGTAKHIDQRRESKLPLQKWIELMIKNSSR